MRPYPCRTHQAYQRGCDTCLHYMRWVFRRRQDGLAAGTWIGLIDAGPARRFLLTISPPLTYLQIATDTGVSQYSLAAIRNGERRRCSAEIADAILGTRLDPTTDTDRVPSVGTARRLQALCVAGWSAENIATELTRATGLRYTRSAVSHWRIPHWPRIPRDSAGAVDRVWQELRDQPGPSQMIRTYGKKYGYPPAEAWTDETIDLLDARPFEGHPSEGDWVVVQRVFERGWWTDRDSPLDGLDLPDMAMLYRLHLEHGGTENGFRERYKPPAGVVPKILRGMGIDPARNRRYRAQKERAREDAQADDSPHDRPVCGDTVGVGRPGGNNDNRAAA